jgi:hypothetical protein
MSHQIPLHSCSCTARLRERLGEEKLAKMLVHEDAGSSIREPSDDVEKRRRRVLLPMAPHACGFSLRLQSGQHSLETTQRSRQIANQSRRDGRESISSNLDFLLSWCGQHSLETTQRSRQIANQSRRDGWVEIRARNSPVGTGRKSISSNLDFLLSWYGQHSLETTQRSR